MSLTLSSLSLMRKAKKEKGGPLQKHDDSFQQVPLHHQQQAVSERRSEARKTQSTSNINER